jgi:hypothetical protein
MHGIVLSDGVLEAEGENVGREWMSMKEVSWPV